MPKEDSKRQHHGNNSGYRLVRYNAFDTQLAEPIAGGGSHVRM